MLRPSEGDDADAGSRSHGNERVTNHERPPLAGGFESPSLITPNGSVLPAYEVKFLLTEAQATEVERRASGHLVYDPYADPKLGHAYHTTSLYFDTAEFDVFHRRPPHKRRKHRLRRYEHSPWVFLERKMKWGDRVKKRRTKIPESELALLAQLDNTAEGMWPGQWFQRCLQQRRLLPICRIAYERVALVGHNTDGPLRLTFDRRVRGTLTREWRLAPLRDGLQVLDDKVICEFKYRSFLPAVFREIIEDMRLTPQPISKYRSYMAATGITPTESSSSLPESRTQSSSCP